MIKKTNYVFGIHALNEVLDKTPQRVLRLLVLSDRHDERMKKILKLAAKNSIVVEKKSRDELDKICLDANHQGVAAHCKPLQKLSEKDLLTLVESTAKPFFLILDGVQDPHNLGACLRSADAAGVTAVIAPKDRSAGLSDTVFKVASGAVDTVPFIQVTNLVRTIKFLQKNNIWVYGADACADKYFYAENLTGSIAIVMGAEGGGLRRLTIDVCDGLIKIPLFGSVSSLNVSVAAGIMLFEVVRQRTNI